MLIVRTYIKKKKERKRKHKIQKEELGHGTSCREHLP
jgi:hypothetical protein